MDTAYEQLLEYINTLTIFDTHEHLPGTEEEWRRQPADAITEFLRHYFNVDIVAAGLPVERIFDVWNMQIPFMQRWELIREHWMNAKNTGYGRSVAIAARDIYGIDRIDTDTIEELDRRLQKAKSEPGHYEYVLRQRCNIETSMLDEDLGCDRRYFHSVHRLDQFVMPTIEGIERLEQKHGFRVTCLADWLELCEKDLDDALARGAAALKCGLAYRRSLRFDRATLSEAEEQFGSRSDIYGGNKALRFGKEFQDYMMHAILRMANRRGLVFQFHTGLQEGNRNMLENCDPSLLNNLFNEYRDIKFDIFHMGYPFQSKLCVLSKYYTNVFIDMAWAHIVSPAACVSALNEWLDTVPVTKIFGFGGDYALVDGVYGHQYIARRNIARALSMKVEQGVFDVPEACEVAKKLLWDNPKRVFGL